MTTTGHAGTIRIGDLEVRRMGYGAMRLPGPMVWGEPADPDRARAVLRRAVELGVNLIDSAWYYGPDVAHRLIAEALHPYPADLVIATKLGGKRLPDKSWAAYARPAELRLGLEHDLRLLRKERIDVVHFRAIPQKDVPFAESLGAMIDLQREGKIRHLGVSNVTRAQLEEALKMTPIVTVQNLFNVTERGSGGMYGTAVEEGRDAVLDACAARNIAFLPYFPLAMGKLGEPHPALAAAAKRHGAKPAQIAIAWLLQRSPVMLPIPGTGSLEHLEENWAAQSIKLDDAELAAIGDGG